MNPDCFSTSGEQTKGEGTAGWCVEDRVREWEETEEELALLGSRKWWAGTDFFQAFCNFFFLVKIAQSAVLPTFVYPLLNGWISVCGGSWECLNKELCVKNARAPLGIRPLIPVNLRNAAAQRPDFPPWKSDPSFSPSLDFSVPFFLFCPSPQCIRLSHPRLPHVLNVWPGCPPCAHHNVPVCINTDVSSGITFPRPKHRPRSCSTTKCFEKIDPRADLEGCCPLWVCVCERVWCRWWGVSAVKILVLWLKKYFFPHLLYPPASFCWHRWLLSLSPYQYFKVCVLRLGRSSKNGTSTESFGLLVMAAGKSASMACF